MAKHTESHTGVEVDREFNNGEEVLIGYGCRHKKILFADLKIYCFSFYLRKDELIAALKKDKNINQNAHEFFIRNPHLQKRARLTFVRSLPKAMVKRSLAEELGPHCVPDDPATEIAKLDPFLAGEISNGATLQFCFKGESELWGGFEGPESSIESSGLVRALTHNFLKTVGFVRGLHAALDKELPGFFANNKDAIEGNVVNDAAEAGNNGNSLKPNIPLSNSSTSVGRSADNSLSSADENEKGSNNMNRNSICGPGVRDVKSWADVSEMLNAYSGDGSSSSSTKMPRRIEGTLLKCQLDSGSGLRGKLLRAWSPRYVEVKPNAYSISYKKTKSTSQESAKIYDLQTANLVIEPVDEKEKPKKYIWKLVEKRGMLEFGSSAISPNGSSLMLGQTVDKQLLRLATTNLDDARKWVAAIAAVIRLAQGEKILDRVPLGQLGALSLDNLRNRNNRLGANLSGRNNIDVSLSPTAASSIGGASSLADGEDVRRSGNFRNSQCLQGTMETIDENVATNSVQMANGKVALSAEDASRYFKMLVAILVVLVSAAVAAVKFL